MAHIWWTGRRDSRENIHSVPVVWRGFVLRRGLDNSTRKSGEERAPGAACGSDAREKVQNKVFCVKREKGGNEGERLS